MTTATRITATEGLAIIGRQSSSEAGDGDGDGDGAMVGSVEALAAFMAVEALVDSMVVEASMAVLAAGTAADIGKPQSC